MGTGALSHRVKPEGCQADHSPPTSAEVKNTWIYTPTPTYAFMTLCLILPPNIIRIITLRYEMGYEIK
jgi:hypothetical protein